VEGAGGVGASAVDAGETGIASSELLAVGEVSMGEM
jgi:hypothetical protein